MKYLKVKKIENVDSEPVYHLTVDKNHNFFANNLCVHNCDYTGNVGIILLNTDLHNSFEIKHGDRIAQGVINEVKQVEWDKVNTMEDLGKTDRGQGGFGHTGV